MKDQALLILCSVVLLGMAIFGGALAQSGLAIGLLTAVAFLVLALKSKLIRGFARSAPLMADVMATGVAYLLFPGGVTAFVGSGVVALSVTILISLDRILHPPVPSPEESPALLYRVEALRVQEK